MKEGFSLCCFVICGQGKVTKVVSKLMASSRHHALFSLCFCSVSAVTVQVCEHELCTADIANSKWVSNPAAVLLPLMHLISA